VFGELFRNLAAALVCVLMIVCVILADLLTSSLIFCCILFTIIDVVGLAYAMGMTLNPFSAISLIVGIGMCVDYGVHISHSYVVSKGSKIERVRNGFVFIGPAIMHGGASTILALLPIAFSESHSFTVFFRLATSFVSIGLFHSLLFLPVMLMLFGSDNKEEDHKEEVGGDNCQEFDSTQTNIANKEVHDGINNPNFKSEQG